MEFLANQIAIARQQIDELRAEVEALKQQVRELTKQPEPAAAAANE